MAQGSGGGSGAAGVPDRDEWGWWWDWWVQPGHVTAVEDLRRAASAGADSNWLGEVSLLRVLDVALWRYDTEARPQLRTKAASDDD